MRLSCFALAAALLCASCGGAGGAKSPAKEASCSVRHEGDAKRLYTYTTRNGTDEATYSIASIGNHTVALTGKLGVITPQDLAHTILADPKSDNAERIVLIWPYSGWDKATFANALEKLVHKPVIGFPGPVWWYPDGTAISTYAEQSTMAGPNKDNIASCVSKEGKYLEEDECKELFQDLKDEKPIFGNVKFILNCDEIRDLEPRAENNEPEANLRLYFLHMFVNIEPEKAAHELLKAAQGGNALANYLVAYSAKNKPKPDKKIYRQFLERAAAAGYPKAQDELAELE